MTQEQLLDLYPKEANSTRYINAVNKKISTPTQSDTQLTPKHCEVAIWALKKDLEKVPTGSPLWQHLTSLIFLFEEKLKAWRPLSEQLKELTTFAKQVEEEHKKTSEALKQAEKALASQDSRTTIINAQSVTVAEMHHNDKNNTRIH